MLYKYLSAPNQLYLNIYTANLLDNLPGRSDEDELGLKYDEIDDYLEGKSLPEEIVQKIESRYLQTEHKRVLPVTPTDTWWMKNE